MGLGQRDIPYALIVTVVEQYSRILAVSVGAPENILASPLALRWQKTHNSWYKCLDTGTHTSQSSTPSYTGMDPLLTERRELTMVLSPKTIDLINVLAERSVKQGNVYSKFCKLTHGLDKALGTTDRSNTNSVVWYTASVVGFMIGLAFSPIFFMQRMMCAAQMGFEAAQLGEEFWFSMRSMTLRVEQETENLFRNLNF
jgi:hypothetical protein